MAYQKRIVCFFDILGFGDVVRNSIMNSESIEKMFDEIHDIITQYKNDKIQISHFSDSIIISVEHLQSPDQLRFIRDVLIKLLENNLLARGAMVFGEICHTESHIFGPALVKAVSLEKKAIYPRIILHESLDDSPLPTIGNGSINHRDFYNNFFMVKTDDTDGEYYVDLIGTILKLPSEKSETLMANVKQLIIHNIGSNELFEKYSWLKMKMDASIQV